MDSTHEASVDRYPQRVLDEMPTDLQDIAQELNAILMRLSLEKVQAAHRVGRLINRVLNDPRRYGPAAVQQLASYSGIQGGARTLQKCCELGRAFDYNPLVREAKRPMANGQLLTTRHFMELATVVEPEELKRLLTRTRQAAWSAQELRDVIANCESPSCSEPSGRLPEQPLSAEDAMHVLSLYARKLSSFAWDVARGALDELGTLDNDELSEALLARLSEALASAESVAVPLRIAMVRLRSLIKRTQKLVAARQEAQKAADFKARRMPR